jgi:hypothetical protein
MRKIRNAISVIYHAPRMIAGFHIWIKNIKVFKKARWKRLGCPRLWARAEWSSSQADSKWRIKIVAENHSHIYRQAMVYFRLSINPRYGSDILPRYSSTLNRIVIRHKDWRTIECLYAAGGLVRLRRIKCIFEIRFYIKCRMVSVKQTILGSVEPVARRWSSWNGIDPFAR